MKRFFPSWKITYAFLFLGLTGILVRSVVVGISYQKENESLLSEANTLHKKIGTLQGNISTLSATLASTSSELMRLSSRDEYHINQELEKEIQNINVTYRKSASLHERLNDLVYAKVKTDSMETLYTKAFTQLAHKQYTSASATLQDLEKKIGDAEALLATSVSIPANTFVSNELPKTGYRRQRVDIDIGSYLLDVVAADLSSSRVIVDTASDSDCKNDCPVLSLSTYVSRTSAFAGINGSYFCPASYPSCVGKTNSFDTLLMNSKKHYFNSDNNVYSNVPAVIFSGTSARFVGRSLEWGRDTGVDAVLANQPLLVSGGKTTFDGNSDPKQGSKGSRSFVGATGATAYIGVVHGVTVAEMARVLAGIGMQSALNLDSGGSTALWFQGYKVGPGRDIPNALLFVRK